RKVARARRKRLWAARSSQRWQAAGRATPQLGVARGGHRGSRPPQPLQSIWPSPLVALSLSASSHRRRLSRWLLQLQPWDGQIREICEGELLGMNWRFVNPVTANRKSRMYSLRRL
ncbi:hypothetical protein EJB05_22540, partial [Eragrostis curvula]